MIDLNKGIQIGYEYGWFFFCNFCRVVLRSFGTIISAIIIVFGFFQNFFLLFGFWFFIFFFAQCTKFIHIWEIKMLRVWTIRSRLFYSIDYCVSECDDQIIENKNWRRCWCGCGCNMDVDVSRSRRGRCRVGLLWDKKCCVDKQKRQRRQRQRQRQLRRLRRKRQQHQRLLFSIFYLVEDVKMEMDMEMEMVTDQQFAGSMSKILA